MSYGKSKEIPIMYSLMGAMSRMGYPVVFKGAMVLQALTLDTSLDTMRMTEDIDADWVGLNITNEELYLKINNAVSSLGVPNLFVIQKKNFKVGMSAEFHIMQKGKEDVLFTMDIGVKNNNHHLVYKLPSGVSFIGSHPNKIYSDKLSAISTRKVYRRVKDIYDMYLLSHISGFHLNSIRTALRDAGRDLESFNEFINDPMKPKGLEYAYDRMKSIKNKPDYQEMYNRVSKFIEPFIIGVKVDGHWLVNPYTGEGFWSYK